MVSSWVKPLFRYIFAPVFCAIKRGACWFLALIFGWVVPFIDPVFDSLPDKPSVDWSLALTFFSLADAWFPMTEGFVFLGGYLVLACIVVAVKTVLALIPGT